MLKTKRNPQSHSYIVALSILAEQATFELTCKYNDVMISGGDW